MIIDLRDLLNCIEVQKRTNVSDNPKMGIVNHPLCSYNAGEVILFRNNEGKLNVEKPMNYEQIEKEKARGSLLITLTCIVNVPRGYVEEVLL